MEIGLDEVARLLGEKDLELFVALRRCAELERMIAVLEQGDNEEPGDGGD